MLYCILHTQLLEKIFYKEINNGEFSCMLLALIDGTSLCPSFSLEPV